MRWKISARGRRSALNNMFEYQKELNKIEQWIEQWIEKLPYSSANSSAKVEITMQDGTELFLNKEKRNPIGFQSKETN